VVPSESAPSYDGRWRRRPDLPGWRRRRDAARDGPNGRTVVGGEREATILVSVRRGHTDDATGWFAGSSVCREARDSSRAPNLAVSALVGICSRGDGEPGRQGDAQRPAPVADEVRRLRRSGIVDVLWIATTTSEHRRSVDTPPPTIDLPFPRRAHPLLIEGLALEGSVASTR
jgi:hypothetical protein